jgi:hypothetical protein
LVILRIIGIVLPQLLLLQFLGSMYDFIGGWNRAPGASFIEILIILFLLNPVVTIAWVIAEPVRYFRRGKIQNGLHCLLMTVLALLLFIESLAIDFFILTQIRM